MGTEAILAMTTLGAAFGLIMLATLWHEDHGILGRQVEQLEATVNGLRKQLETLDEALAAEKNELFHTASERDNLLEKYNALVEKITCLLDD